LGVPALARQRQSQAAGQQQQPQEEGVRLGAGTTALLGLGLLAVVAGVLDLGQAAALGVGAVEDGKPGPIATQTCGAGEQAAAGVLVPAVDGEAQPCQPAADGAGAAPVQQGSLAEDGQGVAFDGQEQAVQEDGQGQAGPDPEAVGRADTVS